jgi:hypothetical protein
MSEINNRSLTRRQFLGHSAVAAGALAITLQGRPGQSAVPAPGASLAYWDGVRFVAADHLATGDRSLCETGARITIHGSVHKGQQIRSIDTLFPATIAGEDLHIPFYAWTAHSHCSSDVSFTAPVSEQNGLILAVNHEDAATQLHLRVTSASGALKLREGIYALVPRSVRLSTCLLDQEKSKTGQVVCRSLSGLVPANFEHLLITVQHA